MDRIGNIFADARRLFVRSRVRALVLSPVAFRRRYPGASANEFVANRVAVRVRVAAFAGYPCLVVAGWGRHLGEWGWVISGIGTVGFCVAATWYFWSFRRFEQAFRGKLRPEYVGVFKRGRGLKRLTLEAVLYLVPSTPRESFKADVWEDREAMRARGYGEKWINITTVSRAVWLVASALKDQILDALLLRTKRP
jgi:hypothetical protein